MGEPEICEMNLQFSSLDSNWLPNNNAYGLHDDFYGYQSNVSLETSNGDHNEPVLVPKWMQCQQTPQNYVEYLTETGYPETQKQTSCDISNQGPSLGLSDTSSQLEENPGLPNVGDFMTTFTGLEPQYGDQRQDWNEESSHAFQDYSGSGTKCTSEARWKRSRENSYVADHEEHQGLSDVGILFPTFTGLEPQYGVQEQNWNEDSSHDFQAYSGSGSAVPECISEARRKRAREKSCTADRCRRLKISHWMDELKKLVPQPQEVGKDDVLDNVIDHVKYLQNQVKDLSRSRLGGERISNSVIYLEGHGHYIVEEQMLDGPLEQIMGKLIDVFPSAATELLHSRGLVAMPLTFAEGFREPLKIPGTQGFMQKNMVCHNSLNSLETWDCWR